MQKPKKKNIQKKKKKNFHKSGNLQGSKRKPTCKIGKRKMGFTQKQKIFNQNPNGTVKNTYTI